VENYPLVGVACVKLPAFPVVSDIDKPPECVPTIIRTSGIRLQKAKSNVKTHKAIQ
jgi:hypothetical protein